MPASIVQPRQMIIGGGAINQLTHVLQSVNLRRPFLVTDAFMVQSGNAERITSALDQAGMDWAQFSDKIGRASCRERVWITEGQDALWKERAAHTTGTE